MKSPPTNPTKTAVQYAGRNRWARRHDWGGESIERMLTGVGVVGQFEDAPDRPFGGIGHCPCRRARPWSVRWRVSVLECAWPLALWLRRKKAAPGRLRAIGTQSARGLAHSKSFATSRPLGGA